MIIVSFCYCLSNEDFWNDFCFADDNYSECNIACLNNQGELSVYSVSTLRQQLEASCLRREDIKWVIKNPEYLCTCDLN